jgi:hypothetical protein
MSYKEELQAHYKAVRKRMLQNAIQQKNPPPPPTPEPSNPPEAGLVTEKSEQAIVDDAMNKTNTFFSNVQAAKMMAEEIANSPKLPPIPGLVLNEIGAIRWMRVLHAVARQHGVEATEILSHSRQRHVVVARFEVFYRLRIDLGMSYKKIADLMKKDHTTILYGVHKVRKHLLDHSSEVSESGMLRFGKHPAERGTHNTPLVSAV